VVGFENAIFAVVSGTLLIQTRIFISLYFVGTKVVMENKKAIESMAFFNDIFLRLFSS
jgi:hypothetical protein